MSDLQTFRNLVDARLSYIELLNRPTNVEAPTPIPILIDTTIYGQETCIREYSSPVVGTLIRFRVSKGDLLEAGKAFAAILPENETKAVTICIDYPAEVVEVLVDEGMTIDLHEPLIRVQDALHVIESYIDSTSAITLTRKEVGAVRIAYLDDELDDFDQTNAKLIRNEDGGGEGWQAFIYRNDEPPGGPRKRSPMELSVIEGPPPWSLPPYAPGWLRRRVESQENMLIGRYSYVENTDKAGALLEEPIPAISWLSKPNEKVQASWRNYLSVINPDWQASPAQKWATVDYFVDWLLYGLGHPLVPTRPISPSDDQAHSRLWQVFHPTGAYLFPYDYLGALLEELSDEIRPIPRLLPMKKAREWAEELFPFKSFDNRADLVVDPQTGAGRLLLAASNYSMNLIGLETDPFLAKIAIINAYLWAPWIVYPWKLLCFNPELKIQQLEYALGRTLTILRRKKINTDYFSATEPHPSGSVYQPIQLLQTRQSGSVYQPIQPLQTRQSLIFEGFAHTPFGIISAVKADPPLLPTSRVEVLPPASLFGQPELSAAQPPLFGSSDRALSPEQPPFAETFQALPPTQKALPPFAETFPALPPAQKALPPSDPS